MSSLAFFATPYGWALVCLGVAVLIVTPGYMSPYMNRMALPAPLPKSFPYRSALRAVLIVFLLLFGLTAIARFTFGFGRDSDVFVALSVVLLLILIWKDPPDASARG